LSIYQIIKKPVASDKATKLNQRHGKLVLEVHPAANKPMIVEALEKLFDVKIKKIQIIIRKGKIRRVKRKEFRGTLRKRAIITLKEGYSLDSISQAGAHTAVSGSESASDK